ncbi:MAG: hypothetical protein ACKO11_12320, partial [Cuspidothrix sp.]
MTSATPESLSKFVQFCQQHITGQERKEAQTFLDRFFRAFGHEGALDAGATSAAALPPFLPPFPPFFSSFFFPPLFFLSLPPLFSSLPL